MNWSPRQFETWYSKRAFESERYCFTGRDEQVSTHEFYCGPGGGLTASRQPVATDVLAHPKYRAQGAICATGREDLMKPVGFPIFFSSDLDTLDLVGLTTE